MSSANKLTSWNNFWSTPYCYSPRNEIKCIKFIGTLKWTHTLKKYWVNFPSKDTPSSIKDGVRMLKSWLHKVQKKVTKMITWLENKKGNVKWNNDHLICQAPGTISCFTKVQKHLQGVLMPLRAWAKIMTNGLILVF